jgi:hypothetical protein
VHRLRDVDTAGFGKTFESGCDVHPVTIDLVSIDDDFTEIDANTKLDFSLVRKIIIAVVKIPLYRYRTDEGIRHSGKISEHGITGEV